MLAETFFDNWHLQGIVRLVVASALGALVGLEREHHGRSAGLRTHLLVALGAAVAMLVSLHFGEVYGGSGEPIRVDPARVAYGVMGGIGFLGAGAIIHYGAGVRGLTTAASLWCSAAIGLAAGFGMFAIALATTGVVLFALVVLDAVERRIPTRLSKRVTITVPGTDREVIERYSDLLTGSGVRVVGLSTDCDFRADRSILTFSISAPVEAFPEALRKLREGAPEIQHLLVE